MWLTRKQSAKKISEKDHKSKVNPSSRIRTGGTALSMKKSIERYVLATSKLGFLARKWTQLPVGK